MKILNTGYFWLDTWILANIIQLSTQNFCRQYLNRRNDPCGRQYDQMTQAARSGQANIAEGNSRHNTSRETEMRLTDVARASIAELAGDYTNWLLFNESVPWSIKSPDHIAVCNTSLDRPTYKYDVQHLSGLHILTQKHKFDKWLESGDSILAANCLLILCNRLISMLGKQIKNQLETFKTEGGFKEALSTERLEYRNQQNQDSDAPRCPKCGKPMIKRMAKKGEKHWQSFLGLLELSKMRWDVECRGKRVNLI
ncbi:MAG: four helix bundle suffix domain-containing protein [Bacteroidales bacterium]|nr:four helix bundle suffix domain-containing protein [Bacteroidales bacterium]